MKLPQALILGLILGPLLAFPSYVQAETIASQTQEYGNNLNVWQVIAELGTNLSGTVTTFTFRVSTSKTNLEQFDNTAANSRLYNKTLNTYIPGCVPSNANLNDVLKGLTFNTSGVPTGYQDVTIDFSCHNYSFISGHKYLIRISNANFPNTGVGRILFGAASYNGSANDYFTGGGLRYAFDNKTCNTSAYVWNSQSANSGCNLWTTTKDDLYFILKNSNPDPTPTPTPILVSFKNPVIFIPGIGGSELKTTQDIVWSQDDGHGGTFSHAYSSGEKIWINQDEAAKLGDDDYFDVLRLKEDGVTSEAQLSLTGNLTSFGYDQIEPFFEELGYVKNIDFFIFPYDWRKDVRSTKDSLDNLVETAKTTSGKSEVDIVTHSMGGLIARYYISDSEKASKIGKLIELGVPHLGAVSGLKAILNGSNITYNFYGLSVPIIPESQVKDVFRNSVSAFQLLPSKLYYDFYTNSDKTLPYPFSDERDIDNDKVTGSLNFSQIKNLLANLSTNMIVFNFAEQFHDLIDPILNQSNNVKIYTIGGTGFDTLGQIHETWLIKWPIQLIPITDEIKIDGDETVPIYSTIPKNNTKDITGATKIYYVAQKHGDLVRKTGLAMETVKAILNEGDIPVEVKGQKISIDGIQISVFEGELDLYDNSGNHTGLKDNGEGETNIPDTSFSGSTNSRHAFVKKGAQLTVKIKSKDSSKVNIKTRNYSQDEITKVVLYKDIEVLKDSEIISNLDSNTTDSLILQVNNQNISPTSEVTGSGVTDQTLPSTSIEISGTSSKTITLTGTDSESGILKIEYSLDNGKTVQVYTEPFTITTTGKTTLQVKSIDKVGNEEVPQEKIIEINSTSSNSSSNDSSGSSSSGSSDSTSNTTSSSDTETVIVSAIKQSNPSILGVDTESPILSAQLSGDNKTPTIDNKLNPVLSGLLMASGGIIAIASAGLVFTFIKPIHPTPK